MSLMAANGNRNDLQWPPEFRCENCGWWGESRLVRWFFPGGEMKKCAHPGVNEPTWRSFVCRRHTSGAHANIQRSIETLERQQEIIMGKLREHT